MKLCKQLICIMSPTQTMNWSRYCLPIKMSPQYYVAFHLGLIVVLNVPEARFTTVAHWICRYCSKTTLQLVHPVKCMGLSSSMIVGNIIETLKTIKLTYLMSTLQSRSNSQDGEEAWVYDHFFYRKTHGVFLEMGGLDGHLFSNTVLLESEAGWRGILIEPSIGKRFLFLLRSHLKAFF